MIFYIYGMDSRWGCYFLTRKTSFLLILSSSLHFPGLPHLSCSFKLLTHTSKHIENLLSSPENRRFLRVLFHYIYVDGSRTHAPSTQSGQKSRSHTTVNRLSLRLHYLFPTRINLSGCWHSIRNIWKQMKQHETHKKDWNPSTPFWFCSVRRLYSKVNNY